VFEFDKYERDKHATPLARPAAELPPVRKVEKCAFLLWGEHCIECAAPDCYKTCDLYVPRGDGRCRRFEYGICENEAIAGSRGAGAELVFGKWAKIEARGNVKLIGSSRLETYERWAQRVSKVLNVAGKAVANAVSDERWRYAAFALSERLNSALRKADSHDVPDGFLIEAYNPTPQPLGFSLCISANMALVKQRMSVDSVPRPFQMKLNIPPGAYSLLVPYEEFRTVVESAFPFNISLTPQGGNGHHIVFRTLDIVQLPAAERAFQVAAPIHTPDAKRASAAKCIVFDLDNVLWEGVLLEDENVKLRPFVQQMLREFDERGILLSVSSKNSEEQALAKLRDIGVEEYLLFPKITWGPKSESVRRIAKEIDISLDTLVFVDDNPFELAEVSKALPEVECIDAVHLDALLAHPRLQGSTSVEARTRRKMYREAMARQEVQSAFGDDYISFLKACEIRLTIRPYRPEDLERVAELVQRTNQLNFSGHKYGRDELTLLAENPAIERYVLICEDRFGQYGMVGFCMAERDGMSVRVKDLMLSCRVQGKFIEVALFHYLCFGAGREATRIDVNFTKTRRNAPAQQVLTKAGFEFGADTGAWRVVDANTFGAEFILVETEYPPHGRPIMR
jgi:FkbH-like protein